MFRLKIHIDKKLKSVCPALILNCLECKITIRDSTPAFRAEFEKSSKLISSRLAIEDISSIPAIKASRAAFKILGKDPARYRFSAEALIRRIAGKKELYWVNNAVDILNFISVQSGISIGGYDSMKIDGEIACGIGNQDEPYIGIGRGNLNIDRMIVLRDNSGAFGSPVSDSEKTKVDFETEKFLMIFFNFAGDNAISKWKEMAVKLLTEYADASVFDYQVVT